MASSLFIAQNKNTVNFNISNDSDRINKFIYRNKMLNDNFYDQVEKELGNVYSKSVELGLISQIDDTNNLFRMIVEETSKVYDSGVYRTFDENEAIQEDMAMLYEDLNINDILTQSNLYINAFNDCLLQVGLKDDEFTLKLRRPDNTIVKTNSDLELEEVYVYIGEVEGGQKWYGYTDSEMFAVIVARAEDVLDDSLEIMPQDGKEDTINILGFLPFVAIHSGYRDDEFWQMYKGDDLVKGTIQVAIKLTFLNHLIKLQSFNQLVASGSNLRQLNGAVLDPQTILFVEGEDTKIDVLKLESNYKALWETIQAINNNIALNYKISPNMFRLTGSTSSGFALKMENIKLDKFVAKQQKMYKGVEKKLFTLLKNIDDKMSLGLIKSEKVMISFPPTQYPMSEQEVLEVQEKEIALGFISPIEIIVERDGVDEVEAKEVYLKNISDRNLGNEQFNRVEPTVNIPFEGN